MTPEGHARARERGERRRGRGRASRNRVLAAAALIVAFGIGVALGEALHDNPHPGGEQTTVRTFPPLTATESP